MLTVSVVICAYTEDRWDTLVAGVQSVRDQRRPADQLVIVVDHNEALLLRASIAFPDTEVVGNEADRRGIAGARNTGAGRASGDVIAYLDDDAVAEPDWLAELLDPYKDPTVIGTGSWIEAAWSGPVPRWFPEEFGWVVGCSYRGQPVAVAPVRNFIANGMSLRKEAFEVAGPFLTDIGRIGVVPLGCEETELCIRVGKRFPDSQLLHIPSARIHHDVPAARLTVRYFLLRCFAEGLSKDAVSRYAGTGPALATERDYTVKVLPRGVLRGLGQAVRGDLFGLAEAAMIVLGLVTTVLGFTGGRTGIFRRLGAVWGDRRIKGRNQPTPAVVSGTAGTDPALPSPPDAAGVP